MSETTTGPNRVLWLSTIGFTLMFAVWLMFGILGKPIQQEFGLTEVELSWIVAAAALNGSLWRLPTGMITDRIGGRKVMTFLLAATAVPAFLVSRADSYAMLLVLAFFVGFGGNSFSAGIAWNSAWFPRHRQGFALGVPADTMAEVRNENAQLKAQVQQYEAPPPTRGSTAGTALGSTTYAHYSAALTEPLGRWNVRERALAPVCEIVECSPPAAICSESLLVSGRP